MINISRTRVILLSSLLKKKIGWRKRQFYNVVTAITRLSSIVVPSIALVRGWVRVIIILCTWSSRLLHVHVSLRWGCKDSILGRQVSAKVFGDSRNRYLYGRIKVGASFLSSRLRSCSLPWSYLGRWHLVDGQECWPITGPPVSIYIYIYNYIYIYIPLYTYCKMNFICLGEFSPDWSACRSLNSR